MLAGPASYLFCAAARIDELLPDGATRIEPGTKRFRRIAGGAHRRRLWSCRAVGDARRERGKPVEYALACSNKPKVCSPTEPPSRNRSWRRGGKGARCPSYPQKPTWAWCWRRSSKVILAQRHWHSTQDRIKFLADRIDVGGLLPRTGVLAARHITVMLSGSDHQQALRPILGS
jgi:hypothetical protein